ncbi:MAG: Cysteine protease atg4 [Alyxoria varia]|nr:MAG: Cysteine protease atg4 [Alyxoria varia]
MSNVDIGRYSKRLVQYLWDPEPLNDDSSASEIWCLGRRYDRRTAAPRSTTSTHSQQVPAFESQEVSIEHSQPSIGRLSASTVDPPASRERSDEDNATNGAANVEAESESWPDDFLDDFESRIWLTYRSGFSPIPKSNDPKATAAMTLSVRLKSQFGSQEGFTTDSGWGCMIRSGQCLLANALAILLLGRAWRRGASIGEERKILQLFADDPAAPFSIHNFVQHGASECGTFPGQWFGPSATAKCIAALSDCHPEVGLKVYVTGDGPDVFEDELFSLAKQDSGRFDPTLLLVGTRLGIDRVTPVYWEALKACLRVPQAVGIAGGRPSASHYFVGTQDSNFFYLDPHHTRPALRRRSNVDEYDDEETSSCHTRRLRRIPLEQMDPSMLIAFLFKDEEDWRDWKRRMESVPGKNVVHVAAARPSGQGHSMERDGAVDEVQTFDDENDDEDYDDDNADKEDARKDCDGAASGQDDAA